MIRNKDRSGWFGASDTSMIMGNWKTKTFEKWWLEKCGVSSRIFHSKAMQTGTHLEHRILDHLGIKRRDRQIRQRLLRLRVNLDGETPEEIIEVKTHSSETFKVSKAYWQQCQVEMFASGLYFCKQKKCRIVAYRVLPEDHKNYFLPIVPERISIYPICYDQDWILNQYLPRLRYLKKCLKRGSWPDVENISNRS